MHDTNIQVTPISKLKRKSPINTQIRHKEKNLVNQGIKRSKNDSTKHLFCLVFHNNTWYITYILVSIISITFWWGVYNTHLTTNIELFLVLINNFPPFINVTNISILVATGVLDMLLLCLLVLSALISLLSPVTYLLRFCMNTLHN